MFEYLEQGSVVASIISFIAVSLLLLNSKYAPGYILGLIFILVGLNIYTSSDIKSTIESNTAQFKKGIVLTCRSDDYNKYRVSNKEWQLDSDTFIKESLMIRADKCKIK